MALSPQLVSAKSTVALPAISPQARAAAIPITLGLSRQTVDVSCESLPPGQALGSLGSVFIDNTQNVQPVTVSFPDTGMSNVIPGDSATYILAITGAQRFTVTSPVLVDTPLTVLVLNTEVQPTGIQPIAGTVVISAGSVTVLNPGPVAGAVVSRSAVIPTTTSTVLVAANTGRKYLLFQMPQASDGWINLNGGTAAPNAVDSFYLQAGEKYESGLFVPDQQISVYLTTGATMSALEG